MSVCSKLHKFDLLRSERAQVFTDEVGTVGSLPGTGRNMGCSSPACSHIWTSRVTPAFGVLEGWAFVLP